MKVSVAQRGNEVRIIGPNGLDMYFRVSGIELPGEVDPSFAVWALLPLAMRLGEDVEIAGAIDPQVEENARKLSRIWEIWAPRDFSEIRITAEGSRTYGAKSLRQTIALFSGGVDSTHALLAKERVAGDRALTVHGMDYKLEADGGRFARLIQKTDPLLEYLHLPRVVIATNAARYIKNLRLTHGFILAACTFLLRDLFENAQVAADYSWEQDMVAFPWGTNHVTNRYFAGSGFALKTVGAEVTRTQKVGAIAARLPEPRSLSFCGNRHYRPDNCGRCCKCVRTKAMFIAMTGSSPDIFVDNTISAGLIGTVDLRDRKERAFFADLFAEARDRDQLDNIPGLAKLMAKHRKRTPTPWATLSAVLRKTAPELSKAPPLHGGKLARSA